MIDTIRWGVVTRRGRWTGDLFLTPAAAEEERHLCAMFHKNERKCPYRVVKLRIIEERY